MERLSKLCVHAPNCKRVANTFCKNRSCKSCCLKLNGGCDRVRGHKLPRALNLQTLAPSFPTPFSQPTSNSSEFTFKFPIDPELTFDNIAKVLQDDNPVLRLREECSSHAAAERQVASHEAQLEAQEDAEYQKAIAESLRSLSPSSPIPSTSTLPNPQPMTPPTAITMAGLPVTRVTASNRPAITVQMSKEWMRPYEDKSKQALQSPDKGQVDTEILRKFRIVWWEKVCRSIQFLLVLTLLQDNVDPAIFTILDCPSWPKWKVTDSPSTLERLGHGTLQFYDIEHKIWVEVPVSYPYTVTTDGYLLLRRAGVSCKDFDNQLSIATSRPNSSARVYMTKVRQSVKTKMLKKKRKTYTYISDDSEGEVEIVEPQC